MKKFWKKVWSILTYKLMTGPIEAHIKNVNRMNALGKERYRCRHCGGDNWK